MLGVGDGQKISAVGRQRAGETRVGLVGEQSGAFVFVVVVEREGLPVGGGEPEDGVERGSEPTREDFRDDFLPGLGIEPKHVLVAGAPDAGVDGEGQDDRLGSARVVVGLDLEQVGLGVERDAHGVGELAVAAHGNEKRAGLAVFGLEGKPFGGEVPPGKFEGGPFTAARAEGEDAGDKRQFADGDAIDKIFAPAVNGVLDLQHIGAVGRNDGAENGVRIETVVVGVGDLPAGGVGETEGGLKPARHGVGEIGDEGAGAGDHDDALAFAGGETDVVDLAGENLAVHDRGQRDFSGGFCPGVARVGFAVGPLRMGAGGGDAHRFAKFRELAHGKDHRVGEAVGGAEANFAFAGRGACGHSHLERDGFGEDGADLAVAAGGELDAHFGRPLFILRRERGFFRVGAGGGALVLQFLGFFAQVVDFLLRERALVTGDPGTDPGAGKIRGGGRREILSADGNREGGALLTAGRIGKGEMGRRTVGVGLREGGAGQ